MELSPMISEFLFYEDDADVAEKSNYIRLKIEIRDLLKDDFNRKILSEVLLDLRKDVSGDTQKRLFTLYSALGLEKDAFAKLESWRWEIISKGILELTLMEVEEAYTFIVKFINSRRATIRKQAEIAAVALKHEGINYFLDTTKYKISEWQQLKLLDVLRNKEDFNPPRFRAWLTSTNKHVVLFALRLIKFYNQNDANTSLIELVKHNDQQVRRQAVECLKEFYVIEALPTLKGVFWKCKVDTKIAILGAIAELGGEPEIEFLETVSEREGNFSVKSKAIGAINAIAPESVMPTENIEHVPAYRSSAPTSQLENEIYEPEHSNISTDTSESDVVNDETTTSGIVKTSSSENQKHSDDAHSEKLGNSEKQKKTRVPNDSNIETQQHKDGIATEPKKPPNSEEPESYSENDKNQINHLPQNSYLMPEEIHNDEALKNIEVTSEEVKADVFEENTLPDTSHFDISDIHFLPLVVEAISETDDISTDLESEKQNDVVAQTEGSVEALDIDPMEDELKALIDEIRELDFLPIVIDDHQSVEKIRSTDRNDSNNHTLETIEGFSLSDLEVRFDKIDTPTQNEPEETPDFHLEEAPISKIDPVESSDAISWVLENNELRNIKCTYETVSYATDAEISESIIPQPIYYDDHETYMMSLLDDLEEMGDQREIPLLRELMAQESKSFIKNRIISMIDTFKRQANLQPKTKTVETANMELPVFSVFADLFKNIDTESKLILLDEVIHVGDEKEIEFLDGLLEDPNTDIRNKAQKVLQYLVAKLAHEKPETLNTRGISAIVSDYLEPTKIETARATKTYESLLSEMELAPSVDSEILHIDFELAEILDRKYEQSILDIEVNSIEVAPNANGGSFLNSLRNFTKLF